MTLTCPATTYCRKNTDVFGVLDKEVFSQYEDKSSSVIPLIGYETTHLPVISANTVFKEDSQTGDEDVYVDTLVFIRTFNKYVVLNNITSGFHFFEEHMSAAISIGKTLRGGLKQCGIWPDEVEKVFIYTSTKRSGANTTANLFIYHNIN